MQLRALSVGARLLIVGLGAILTVTIGGLGWLISERVREHWELRAHPGVVARIEDTLRAVGPDREYPYSYSPEDLRNFPLPDTLADGRQISVPAERLERDDLDPPDREADADTIRIAFVGGSTTVDYPRQVTDALNRLGYRVESHNLAVPGSISGTSLIFMQRYLPRWKPDIVVVYHGFNDLNFVASNEAFSPLDTDQRLSDALRRIRRYYEGMDEYCERNGCILVLSTFAAPDMQLANNLQRERYQVLFREVFPWIGSPERYAELLAAYNEMLREFAVERDLAAIDVAAKHPGNPDFFRDECHRTPEGVAAHSRIVAEELAVILHSVSRDAASAERE